MVEIPDEVLSDFTADERAALDGGDAPPPEVDASEPADAPAEDDAPVAESVDQKKPKPKWLERVDEASAKARAAEERAAKAEAALERGNARLMELAERFAPQKKDEAAPKAPDPEVDPYGHLAHRLALLERNTQEIDKRHGANAEDLALHTFNVQDAGAVRASKPDFDDAVAYLAERQWKAMTAMGMREDEIKHATATATRMRIALAKERGGSPNDALYQQAVAYGYQPRASRNGGDIDRVAAGQRAASGMPKGGGPSAATLTLQRLAEMPADDFNRLTDEDLTRALGFRVG